MTCVGAVALITAVFEPKGEELESKPSTACESSGPLFSSTHLLICETCSAVDPRGGQASGLTREQKARSGRAVNLLIVWVYGPPKGE